MTALKPVTEGPSQAFAVPFWPPKHLSPLVFSMPQRAFLRTQGHTKPL